MSYGVVACKQEPEHLVKKNIKFEDILPDFEYWTRDGKVARMIILKPTLDEHLTIFIVGKYIWHMMDLLTIGELEVYLNFLMMTGI